MNWFEFRYVEYWSINGYCLLCGLVLKWYLHEKSANGLYYILSVDIIWIWCRLGSFKTTFFYTVRYLYLLYVKKWPNIWELENNSEFKQIAAFYFQSLIHAILVKWKWSSLGHNVMKIKRSIPLKYVQVSNCKMANKWVLEANLMINSIDLEYLDWFLFFEMCELIMVFYEIVHRKIMFYPFCHKWTYILFFPFFPNCVFYLPWNCQVCNHNHIVVDEMGNIFDFK